MPIGVLGSGSFGTCLALLCAQRHPVTLWARDPDIADAINRDRRNPRYLSDIELPVGVRATADLSEALDERELVICAVPSHGVREVMTRAAPLLPEQSILVSTVKGIEVETCMRMDQVLEDVLDPVHHPRLVFLSGPSFAREIADEKPTAVTLACQDEDVGTALIQALGSRTFRPYFSADVIGAQIDGAVKNVLAIACGIVTGRSLGENARASLITRGMAEILRLGGAMGAESATLMGLCGLGDLVLTCSSPTSRNMSLGIALAEGAVAKDYLGAQKSVAEGAFTVGALTELAKTLGIEMPIAASVDAIINGGASIDREIESLMSRPFTRELA